jgi:hypothetical protein
VKPAASRPKRRRAYRVSGFHALVAATSRAGLSALDGRSSTARAIRLWQAQVAADLGDDLSAQERTLLDVAAVDMALLAVADAWLKDNAGAIVNRRRRAFVPLVAERLRVASHLAEVLKLLGVKRRPRPIPSLREYLEAKAATAAQDERARAAAAVEVGATAGAPQPAASASEGDP